MNPGLKLAIGGVTVAAACGYLAYLGAASSWQYYLSVDEAMANAEDLSGAGVRINGRVVPGSLSVAEDRRQATFELAGESQSLHAVCHCFVPDNLGEDMEVVVEGTLTPGGIHGHKVITRCASKYEPAGGANDTGDQTRLAPAT